MISVEQIYEDIRKKGLNFGLPMTFVKLGVGKDYSVEALVEEIVMHTKCKWVCMVGKDTTEMGMGTFIKGLVQCGLMIEIECTGEDRDPGWLHSVDRWLVDYTEDSAFNYFALRSQDMVRFVLANGEDLERAARGLEEIKIFTGTKCLEVAQPELAQKAFELARKYDKCRVYQAGISSVLG